MPRSGKAHPAGSAQAFRLESLEERKLLAGSGLAAAYFARTNVTLARYAQVDSTVDLAWPSGTPHASLGDDGFSVRWSGMVLGKFSETHTFTTISQGGVRLWVNDFLIIDQWTHHDLREDQGSLRLTAGKLFDIRLEYWSDGNNPQIQLDWESPRMSRHVVPSNRLYSTEIDSVAPSMPGRLRGNVTDGNTVNLIWDPSSDPSGVVAYDIYIGNAKYWSNLPGETTYTRPSLAPNTGYTFSVVAVDAAGNSSQVATTAITTAAPSNPPPSVPTNLQVADLGDSFVSLTWDPSTDNSAVTGYRIYRNGVKLPGAPTGPSFVDTSVQPNTAYIYSIRSADDEGAFSGFSDWVNPTTLPATSARNPYAGINAPDFDQQSGVAVSGSTLTSLDNNDWVRYSNVEFGGGAGANSVRLDLALSPSSRGGSIELRLDSVNGTLLARHVVQPTGSSSTFQSQQLNITNITGTRNLYVVFKDRSDVARLRSIRFSSASLTRVMPVGDSITEGPLITPTPTYRYYLWQKLLSQGFPNIDFVGSRTQSQNNTDPVNFDFDQNHESHSGWTADEIAGQVANWAAQARPDVVLLHIGTNDLDSGQSVGSTLSDIGRIIDNVRSILPNVKIVLAQILPLVGHESDVNLLNQGIATLAGQKNSSQSPVVLVNLNSGISLADMIDGVHPKAATESLMADRWYAAMASLLQ